MSAQGTATASAPPQVSGPAEETLAHLRVKALARLLPATLQFVAALAADAGLDATACRRLEVAVEEACTNVVEHAYEGVELGDMRIVVLRRPGQLVLRIEDDGLPFDAAQLARGHGGIGSALMRAFADEMSYASLGHRGKRVELVKHLPYRSAEAFMDEAPPTPSLPRASKDEPVTLRLATPDDTVGVARCVYRTYGYTYAEYIYYPDRMRELLQSGLLISCIVLNSAGEVVGHTGMNLETPDARVGETGQAVVDPRYRGLALFERMKSLLVEEARRRGMQGVYSESVTIHPYTQMANLRLGAQETGCLLAFAPSSLRFKAIAGGDDQTVRQSTMIYYLPIVAEAPTPPRMLYVPPPHCEFVQEIYTRLALRRQFATPPTDVGETSAPSDVGVRLIPDFGLGYLTVNRFGADLVEQVKAHLRSLCVQRVDAIMLDLPLEQPSIAARCGDLQALGFGYGAIIPDTVRGDVLRLQYQNNVLLDVDRMHVASDFGRRVLAYVESDRRG